VQVDPFAVVEPTSDSPVVVEVPHAGLWVDAVSAATMLASCRCLARDADLYVDELFADGPDCGAALLTATSSRYVVDLNRAEDDYDGAAVAGAAPRDRPRGVIWHQTSDGQPILGRPLPRSEYERRCASVYRPYHATLARLLGERRARYGFAVLLCAHSMPEPRVRGGGAAGALADVVPGTHGRTTSESVWIDLVEQVARDQRWSVQHDVPYRGGHTTSHYGRPSEGVHVVQLEIARRLYMDETTLARDQAGFATVRAFARGLVEALVREARRRASSEPRARSGAQPA
jgi:N-formylglutamate amidohydrolase